MGEPSYPFGMVMVSTICASVSRRSEMALTPERWILARESVRVLRKLATSVFLGRLGAAERRLATYFPVAATESPRR